MSKLIVGQECYVSSLSEDKALESKAKAFFVGYRKNGAMIFEIDTNHALFTRQYAVPIPEKKLIPWTLETFPMEAVWIREKGVKVRALILSVGEIGVNTEDYYYVFDDLATGYERITNDSIEPCGVYDE